MVWRWEHIPATAVELVAPGAPGQVCQFLSAETSLSLNWTHHWNHLANGQQLSRSLRVSSGLWHTQCGPSPLSGSRVSLQLLAAQRHTLEQLQQPAALPPPATLRHRPNDPPAPPPSFTACRLLARRHSVSLALLPATQCVASTAPPPSSRAPSTPPSTAPASSCPTASCLPPQSSWVPCALSPWGTTAWRTAASVSVTPRRPRQPPPRRRTAVDDSRSCC